MSATGAALLAVFKSQIGKVRYVWGGANPRTGADCSGLMSWDLNRVLRVGIPGYPRAGSFPGTPVHGPVVSDYLQWDGAVTVAAAAAEPGDLVIFGPDVHIGVYAGNGEMVSALNPGLGVAQTPVNATNPGDVPTYRRVRALPGAAILTAAGVATGQQPQGAPVPLVPLLAAAAVVVIVLAAAVGAAAVAAGAATGGRVGLSAAARIPT